MILDLKKVFLDENQTFSAQTTVDLSDINQDGIAAFTEPVAVDIHVSNHAGIVELTADTNFDYRFKCDRCAELSRRNFAYSFHHILVTSLSEDSGDDYIEAPDYKLDTDALLRDDILLELPSKFLCKESCKGLCPKCGQNLNQGSCKCSQKEVDPRLAALLQLLDE